jgi:uncharacterized phage protein gp47/JayE
VADYVDLDLVVDATELSNVALDYMADVISGWTPRPANVITVLLEGNGQMAAEALDQASPIPPAVYATIGETVYGITRQVAVPAVATATFTFAADTPAVMVDAQSQLVVPNPSGDPQVFLTDADITAPAGGGDVQVGVTAEEPGAQANGSFGTAELVTDVDGVETITVTQAQGGVDEEDDDTYLDRLTNLLTLLAPRPILPNDFAVLAMQIPGVGRALAIDLYIPGASENPVGDTDAPECDGTPHTNVPRALTIAITDTDGGAPDTALKQRVWETIDAQREVNFLTYVIGPTYTVIDVQATVVGYPGKIPADVEAAAEAMLAQWLDPANWGTMPGAGGPREWAQNTKARLYEAVDYLNRAQNVFYVTDVQLRGYPVGGSPGAWTTADVDMPGAAPLPQAGTLTVTAELATT